MKTSLFELAHFLESRSPGGLVPRGMKPTGRDNSFAWHMTQDIDSTHFALKS